MLLCCFEAFLGKFTEKFSFGQKIDSLRRSTEILRKLVFLNQFEMGQIPRKIWIGLKKKLIKPVNGDKY